MWQALATIPVGETWTYAQLAAAIGRPTAVRAVGLANGANPIGIVVPCHRVIGANGSLTGFGGGLDRKRWLLRHEGAAFDDAIGARETKAVERRYERRSAAKRAAPSRPDARDDPRQQHSSDSVGRSGRDQPQRADFEALGGDECGQRHDDSDRVRAALWQEGLSRWSPRGWR